MKSVVLTTVLCSALLLVTAHGLPNLRIQVNNDNLHSPPYLIEAIQRAALSSARSETSTTAAPLANQTTTEPPVTREAANQTATVEPPGEPRAAGRLEPDEEAEEGDPHTFSVIKEETIEEILDLEPDSVLRLSPEHLGMAPQEYAKLNNNNSPEGNGKLAENEKNGGEQPAASASQQKHDKKPQLPVTNSHLKRPALGRQEDEDGGEDDNSNEIGANLETAERQKARSRVSPSVVVDEAPNAASVINLEKKRVPTPPDTWEPSQVMHGATKETRIPATITRDYGTHTRTRVTLGGGYMRKKQPPSEDPTIDEERPPPQKPLVPLERPETSEESGGPVEVSRVIEVPDRIVLPASVFSQPASQQVSTSLKFSANETAAAPKPTGKPDARCARRGVSTFEHPTACDKYFYCEDGLASERACPNGLFYGTRDMVRDYCIHRWNAVCGEKTQPNPISTPGCRWQYGIFNVQGSPKCSPDYYECTDGLFEVKKCSIGGQVYDDRTKSCQFAEKVGCAEQTLADFRCPPDDQGNTYWPFPRYFLNDRALIHCVNDKPEIVRCTDDERVDPEHLHCVPREKQGEQGQLTARRERKKTSSSQS